MPIYARCPLERSSKVCLIWLYPKQYESKHGAKMPQDAKLRVIKIGLLYYSLVPSNSTCMQFSSFLLPYTVLNWSFILLILQFLISLDIHVS